ncbi:MAG: MFS transporter [Bryobacteraceae bacterium]
MVRAAQLGALLYVLRNALYAAASFPVGSAADRMDKQTLLSWGYALGAATGIATAWVFASGVAGLAPLAVIFSLAGVYIAVEDTLEGAIPADLVASESRGTAYGLMGSVNGIGDLVASALVGTLWTAASPVSAFMAAAALMALGAALVLWNRGVTAGNGPDCS